MSRDLPCVYRAADIGEANTVVAWLDERGITALVKDEFAAVLMQTPSIVIPQGIEVYVCDIEDARRAVTLLNDHFEAVQTAKDGLSIPVQATCEECGRVTTFPPEQAGSVQECPQCKTYLDLPGSMPS